MIGNVLDDRYELLRILGKGGMGAVYEGRHTGTGRRVAVKVLPGDALDHEHLARFQREARAFGAIESQHIAQVLDVGRDYLTGSPYLVLELLDGEDILALVRRLGPLPVELALRIGVQACLGLERVHEAGIVHRDIKSANLFLARLERGQRVVKLLDFGVAKVSDPRISGGAVTRDGQLLGTPMYMAPEQARSFGSADARSDVWSLGVTLYECLSGRLPHKGLRGLGEIMAAICTQPPPWIQDVAPWIPREVAEVVHGALTLNPAERYPSAAAFGAALQGLLQEDWAIDEAMIRPRGEAPFPTQKVRDTAPPPAPTIAPAPAPPRAAVLALGALAAAAIGGLAVYLAVADDAPSEGPPQAAGLPEARSPSPLPEPMPPAPLPSEPQAPSTPALTPDQLPDVAPARPPPATAPPPPAARASATPRVPARPPPRPRSPIDDETSRK